MAQAKENVSKNGNDNRFISKQSRRREPPSRLRRLPGCFWDWGSWMVSYRLAAGWKACDPSQE